MKQEKDEKEEGKKTWREEATVKVETGEAIGEAKASGTGTLFFYAH